MRRIFQDLGLEMQALLLAFHDLKQTVLVQEWEHPRKEPRNPGRSGASGYARSTTAPEDTSDTRNLPRRPPVGGDREGTSVF